MENIFVEFLPPWVETGLQPAFYDKESGTVLQQTARMYARVNMLIRMFNKLSKNTKTTVEDYINQFNELHDYVHDYFDNLDVQEEINNKLDAMVEDGTLQEIVADYLNARAVFGFDTVADLKNADNLTNGSFARTLGYYAKNDKGSALYKIRTITNDDVVDEKFILEMTNDNTLIAELIVTDTISPEQIGVKRDEVNNDGTYIQDCIDYSKANGVKVAFGNDIYYITTGLNIPLEYSIDFQGITLKAISSVNFTEGMVNIKNTWNIHNGVISNLKLDQNNIAPKGIYLYRSYRRTYENIDIKNTPAGGYGIYLDGDRGGGGNQFNNITGSGNYRNSTFIYVGSNDSVFSHVDYQQYTVGIETNAFVRLFDIHGYVATDDQFPEDWYTNSIFIKIDSGGRIMADELYPDTHNFSFYNYSVLPSQIGKIFFTFNENTPQNSVPSVMFKANNDNVELYYRWKIDSLSLSISNNVLFELIKNSTVSTLSSYLHLNNITGAGNFAIDKPPVFVNRVLPMNNFTKLGIYNGTLVATGTSQYSSTSVERDICKTDIHSGYKLIDGYYSYKGINPDDSSIFDGTVKVANNTVTVIPNTNQKVNFQFFIQVPAQEANIAS